MNCKKTIKRKGVSEMKRHFFNLDDQCSIRSGSDAEDPVDIAWMEGNPQEWLEVSESELPYLEPPALEPGYDWTFKRPERIGRYKEVETHIPINLETMGHGHPREKMRRLSFNYILSGYRWCKKANN